MDFNIIAIEREYASGGMEIGKSVAKALGISYYGEEILRRVALKQGKSLEQLRELERRASGDMNYSLDMLSRLSFGQQTGFTEAAALKSAESDIIRELSLRGRSVIVGRCAGSVLSDRNDVLKVFIHASVCERRKRASERYGLPEDESDDILSAYDKRRSTYYIANSNSRWGDKSEHHLILDSGVLGIENCVKIICSAFGAEIRNMRNTAMGMKRAAVI